MTKAYSYRTEYNDAEYSHIIYANSIEESIKYWIENINDLKDEVYSFDKNMVESIESQYKNKNIEFRENPNTLIYKLNDNYQITYIIEHQKLEFDFIAQLDFLTTENGGRKNYASSGYRPIFKLNNKKEMTSANLIFNDKLKVYPGEKTISLINILSITEFENLLYIGLEFELLEPPRIIAKGLITEIRNEILKKPAGNTI